MSRKFGLIFIMVLLGFFYQNCGENLQATQYASKADVYGLCTKAKTPKYRASVLTKKEMVYVLNYLYPDEVNANPTVIDTANKMPSISVGRVSDETLYSANNRLDMPNEAYINYLIEISENLFSEFSRSSEYERACSSNNFTCLNFILDEVSYLWRMPLIQEEFNLFTKIFPESLSLKERAELSFITAVSSPQFYIKNYISLKDKGLYDKTLVHCHAGSCMTNNIHNFENVAAYIINGGTSGIAGAANQPKPIGSLLLDILHKFDIKYSEYGGRDYIYGVAQKGGFI